MARLDHLRSEGQHSFGPRTSPETALRRRAGKPDQWARKPGGISRIHLASGTQSRLTELHGQLARLAEELQSLCAERSEPSAWVETCNEQFAPPGAGLPRRRKREISARANSRAPAALCRGGRTRLGPRRTGKTLRGPSPGVRDVLTKARAPSRGRLVRFAGWWRTCFA